MSSTAPLAANLRAIDRDRADTQTRLIGALNERSIAGLRTSARAATMRDRRGASAWLQFRAGAHEVAIAPLLVDGTLAHVTGPQGQPDPVGAAAVLDRIEPLVAALETIIGDALHPIGVGAPSDDDPVLLRIDASPNNGPHNRMLIAVPADLTIDPLAEPAIVSPLLGRLRLRWTAAITGPHISAARLDTIGVGDLMLLGIGPLRARLTLPGRRDTLSAKFDMNAEVLDVDDDSPADTAPGAAPQAGVDWNDVKVATIVEIVGGSLTATELATIGKGSILPVPGASATLPVRVKAGDTLIAEGELVAVGEGFGVMITSVAPTEG